MDEKALKVVETLFRDFDVLYDVAMMAVKNAQEDGDYGQQLFEYEDIQTIAELVYANGDYWMIG